MAKDEIATKLSSVRALNDSRDGVLVTSAPPATTSSNRPSYAMANDAEFAQKVNNYSKFDLPYNGETKVMHYLEVLRDEVGFDNLKKAVKNPLTGKKIAAYYGCPAAPAQQGTSRWTTRKTRPFWKDSSSRPSAAPPVSLPLPQRVLRRDMATEDKASASKKSGKVMDSAAEMGRRHDHHRLPALPL